MLINTQAINDITSDNEFKDLHKFTLTEADWSLLENYEEILQVVYCFLLMNNVNFKLLVPHAFQEILSAKNTPTLCYSIPAFNSFINIWNKQKENPEWSDIIQPGIDKLEEYTDKLNDTHIVAMGEIYFIYIIFNIELMV